MVDKRATKRDILGRYGIYKHYSVCKQVRLHCVLHAAMRPEELLPVFFALGLGAVMLYELVRTVKHVEAERPRRVHTKWMRNFLRRRASKQRNTVFKLIDEVVNVSTLAT